MYLAEFTSALRLMRNHVWQRPGRVVLTSLSTIAAACMVVWVVSGYDAMIGEFGSMGEEYVGRYELLLLPKRAEGEGVGDGGPPGGLGGRGLQVSKDLIGALRRDPEVADVDPVFETTLKAHKVGEKPQAGFGGKGLPKEKKDDAESPPANTGPKIMGGMAPAKNQRRDPTVVGTHSSEPAHTLLRGKWFDPTRTDEPRGAITVEAAEQLGVKVGDFVEVSGANKSLTKIQIVAVLEQPRKLPGPKFMVGLPPTKPNALPGGPVSHALYVPMALAEKLSDSPARISYAGVVLKPGVKADEFMARWADAFSKASPPVEARSADSVDREVAGSTTLQTVRAQAYSATAISLLAALFIIFTTLSMGVDERIRQFGMLRAVSFTRGQIALMVALESLLLGLIGWGGGLLAGWGLLQLAGLYKPELLVEGGTLGTWCIVLSGACALGGSLAAAIMPAWKAMSVSPLESMAPRQSTFRAMPPWITTLAGLVLISINPLVIFYLPMPDSQRYLASAAIGCTTMVIGFVLLAPLAVLLIERTLGPVLAFCLRLNSRLLATQLSMNMWRSVGITVALTIGLGLFVTMQVWGYSMLGPFTPGDWAPELLISLGGSGISDAQIAAVQNVPGLAPGRFLPVSFKQVKFADDVTGFKERPSATRQDNCVMIGFDPDAALGGARPLFNFEFVDGNRQDAIAKLKKGRYCLVPDHFVRESGIGLGQSFRVAGAKGEDAIAYEIAAVVSMPGWHWLSKTGLRRARAAGLMFAAYNQVKSDFRTGQPSIFWGDMDGKASESEIKAGIPAALGRAAPTKAPAGKGKGSGAGGGKGGGGTVALTTRESVKAEVYDRADKIIWALSELPLVTLLVTSLGVMNTVQASIRARRWDMGVLRALGITRFDLFRLILSEAILIGAVACLLSLAFGTMAGYCGTGVTRYVDIRGGQVTPLVIPWEKLSVGLGISLALCLLAALWPAFRTGRTEVLRLLQEGRSAT